MKDLSLEVKMLCRVCGNDQFASDYDSDDLVAAPDETEMTCAYCGFKTTKGELIEDNNANIEAGIDELTERCADGLQEELHKALKKAFG